MKKGIIINIILILLIYLIPKPQTIVETADVKPEENQTIVEEAKEAIVTVSNRSENTNREEIKKNINLNPDSDLRVLSNLTTEDFDKMLKSTELEGSGYIFTEIEKKYGINGLYMLGLTCLESNFGKSTFAKERNNLVGWNAIDSNPKKATYFKSKEECLYYVSNRLKANYLSENGCYFNGYSGRAVDKKYCSDTKHIDKICNIVNKLTKKL